MVFSGLQGARNGAGYCGSIQYAVPMLESECRYHETARDSLRETRSLTLIASVRIAAITSREPPRTRLSARVGSYSQMAVAFSTAAIFVMWPITSTLPRLTTCPKQLQRNSIEENRNK